MKISEKILKELPFLYRFFEQNAYVPKNEKLKMTKKRKSIKLGTTNKIIDPFYKNISRYES